VPHPPAPFPRSGRRGKSNVFQGLSPSLLGESLPRFGGGFGERHKKTGGILTE